MKKKLVVGLLLLSLAGLSALAACNPNNNESTGSSAYSLTLNKESIEIDIFQEFYLVAEYNGTKTVAWSVSDSSVVSVENGKLTGLKAGTATVTATAGEYTDTCTVIVSDYKESLFVLETEETNLSMYKGDTKTPTFALKYNGSPISMAAQKSFTSSDSNVATVDENGKISATNFGTAMISVVYTLDKVEVATTLNVSVVSGGTVEIQQRSATIYALGSFMGQEFENSIVLSAKAYEKGVEQTGASIVWSLEEEQDILSLNGSTLTALNAGTTDVSATYTDIAGVKQTDTITVTVLPVSVDSKKSVVLSKDEIVDGYTADLSALVGDTENALTGAWIEASEDVDINLPCDEGKFDFTTISAGEKKLCLATRNVVYELALELWTATISSATELEMLYEATDGWYRLKNDIDMSNTTWKYPASKEFLGKFDGQGFAIKNIALSQVGLFDTLAVSAVVTNVTLQAKISSGATGIGAVATTVKSGATVLIENVSLYVDVAGVSCGGAIGIAGGRTILKNVKGVISNACGDNTNGALFGATTYTPTFEKVNVYSTFKICGQSATPNAATEVLNKTQGVIVVPTMLDEKKNEEFDENEFVSIQCDQESYASYVSYANNERKGGATTGTVSLPSEDAENRFGGYVDLLLTKANGEVKYFALPLSSTILLTNDNFAQYLNTGLKLTGYYVLTEDVDLSGYTNWKGSSILTGTLDGKNYTIRGLQTAHGSGLFAEVNGATVKDIAIVDVQLGDQSGVIARVAVGEAIMVDNVYISLGAQAFSEHSSNYNEKCNQMGIERSSEIGVLTDWYVSKAGVVFQANDKPVKVKNSVIYMPEYLSQAGGFVTGYAYWGAAVVENCTFIGGNGRITGLRTDRQYSENTVTETVICDAVEAHKTHKANWGELQKTAYDANHPYVELNKTNVANVLPTLTSHVVVLTEDIDAETNGINALPYVATPFTGIFDGQGHTIDNILSYNRKRWQGGGLFQTLQGSVKNVVIKGKWGIKSANASNDGGLIANEIANGYIENVYVEQTMGGNYQSIGAIANVVSGISMKDVVVYTMVDEWPLTDINKNLPGMIGSYKTSAPITILENCYYITPNEEVYYANENATMITLNPGKDNEETKKTMPIELVIAQETFFGVQGFKGANAKTDFDAAVKAGTVKLSETLTEMLYPTAN